MVRAAVVILGLALSGCASSIMQGYVGQPVQQAMVDYGPPSTAFDMGDGRRAFQWAMESTGKTPTYVQNSGNVQGYGNSAWWTQNTTITGGQTVTSKCNYTLYGRWSDASNAWLIEGFEKPKFLCE